MEGLLAGDLAELVEAEVAADGKDPGFEAFDPGQLFAVQPDFQEDFLDEFLRVHLLPGIVHGIGIDLVLVLVEELAEGVGISLRYTKQHFPFMIWRG